MQPIQAVEKPISTLFEPIVGKVKIKTYFSYYAVFANGFMLALYKNNMVFLRASTNSKAEIQQLEGTYPLQDHDVGINTKNFYAMSYKFALKTPKFSIWLTSILEELTNQQRLEEEKRKTQVRSLANMNIKMERILKRINIKNVEQFR